MYFQEKHLWGTGLMSSSLFPTLLAVTLRLMPSKGDRHLGTALLTIPRALSGRGCFIKKMYSFLFSPKGKCEFVGFDSVGISLF